MTFKRYKEELYPRLFDLKKEWDEIKPNTLKEGYQKAVDAFMDKLQDEIMFRKEWLLAGFLAETGCLPSELMIVESPFRQDGSKTIYITKKDTEQGSP